MKARVSSRHVTHGKVKENDSYLSELVQREQDMSKIGPLDDGDAWDVGSGLVEAEDDVLVPSSSRSRFCVVFRNWFKSG